MIPTQPHALGTEPRPGRTWVGRAQQALGLAVLVCALAPSYRFMDTSAEAPHREVSVEVAEVTLQLADLGVQAGNGGVQGVDPVLEVFDLRQGRGKVGLELRDEIINRVGGGGARQHPGVVLGGARPYLQS